MNPADKVEQWDIERVIPYARNSRTHSDDQVDQIAASIKEWGFTTAVLIDEDGGIIAGHGRVMAAKKLGIKTIPVMVATGWSDAKKRAYVIADNKLALNAGWDIDLLELEIQELSGLDFDLSLLGFGDEINDFLREVKPTEFPDLPEENKPPFQQLSFTLHDDQAEEVARALDLSKNMGEFDSENPNSNGNALARICEIFLTQNADS